MAKLSKSTLFKAHSTKPETTLDKTSRIARKMVDEDAEQRQAKMARLRKTRLEREANPPSETAVAAPKARPSKAVPKR